MDSSEYLTWRLADIERAAEDLACTAETPAELRQLDLLLELQKRLSDVLVAYVEPQNPT